MPSNISWPSLKGPTKLNAYHILAISFVILAILFKCFLGIKEIIFLLSAEFPIEFSKRELMTKADWERRVTTQITAEILELAYNLVDGLADIFIVYFGILAWLWQVASQIVFTRQIADKRKPIKAEVLHSIVFSLLCVVLDQFIRLPFSIVSGLIKMDITNAIVAAINLVASIIFAIISAGILGTINISLWHRFPRYFFGMEAAFSVAFELILDIRTYKTISRACKQLGTDTFGTQAAALAKKLGFPPERIFVCNRKAVYAHYSGTLHFTRHITIYKGLLNMAPIPTAIAVMGHEIGHWYLMHSYKIAVFLMLIIVAIMVLSYKLAFKPGIYAAFGFEPPQPATRENELAPQFDAKTPLPPRPASKFKSWLMPYYVVTAVLAYYLRPVLFLYDYGLVAFTHLQEYQADRFGATNTRKQDMIDTVYLLQEHAALPTYSGVGDPFVEYCRRTHPGTVNRAKALEEL